MPSSSSFQSTLQVILVVAVLGLCAWSGWLTMENLKLKTALSGGDEGNQGDLAKKVASLEETVENGLVLSLIDPSRGSTLISQEIRPVSDEPIAVRRPAAVPASGPEEEEDPNVPFDFSSGAAVEAEPPPPAKPAVRPKPTPRKKNGGGSKPVAKAKPASTSSKAKPTSNSNSKAKPNPVSGPVPAPEKNPPVSADAVEDVSSTEDKPPSFPALGFHGSQKFLTSGEPVPDSFGPVLPKEPAVPAESSGPATSSVVAREPAPSSGTFGASQNLLDGEGEPYLYELSILEVQGNRYLGLDGGTASGVKPGASFMIFRGKREIGKLQIQEVSENRSIGEITEYVGGVSIRQGDRLVPIRN